MIECECVSASRCTYQYKLNIVIHICVTYDRCSSGARTSERTRLTRCVRRRRLTRTAQCAAAARRSDCAPCVSWSSRRRSARCSRMRSGRSGVSCSAASRASASATRSTRPTACAPTRPFANARTSYSRGGARSGFSNATEPQHACCVWLHRSLVTLHCIHVALIDITNPGAPHLMSSLLPIYLHVAYCFTTSVKNLIVFHHIYFCCI